MYHNIHQIFKQRHLWCQGKVLHLSTSHTSQCLISLVFSVWIVNNAFKPGHVRNWLGQTIIAWNYSFNSWNYFKSCLPKGKLEFMFLLGLVSLVFLPPLKSVFLNSYSIQNPRATGLSVPEFQVLPVSNKVKVFFRETRKCFLFIYCWWVICSVNIHGKQDCNIKYFGLLTNFRLKEGSLFGEHYRICWEMKDLWL